MEELFRFLLTRPAQLADDKVIGKVLPSTEYHAQLRKARATDEPRPILHRLALAYRNSEQALKSIEELNYAQQLGGLYDVFAKHTEMSLKDLDAAVKKWFDREAEQVVKDEKFAQDRERLSDTIVTNIILSNDGPVSSYQAARFLRVIAIIERVAASDATLAAENGIADALDQTLLLPADIFPLTGRRRPDSAPPNEPPIDDENKRYADLRDQRDRLFTTYSILTRVEPEHIATPIETAEAVVGLEPTPRVAFPPVVEAAERELAAEAPPPMAPISGSAMAARLRGAPLLLKPEVTARFGAPEQAILAERNLDLTRVSLTTAVDRLSVELQDIELKLAERGTTGPANIIQFGSAFLPEATIDTGEVVLGKYAAALGPVPTTYGTVAPAGIGDLLVVRQFLKRYEARELAHIENILKGEYKERVHRRALTTEETITVETEVKREEERDQQTTERFELKTESSNILKEDMSFKAGIAISGKYGPTVEFKATTDFALNTSKEEATKVATTYSKDVTSRATSKIFERRREERILKTIEVFEETNKHGVDNKEGADHVISQYQWIDKIYEAQVFNYGKRLLFDIMLPEPAAFLLYAIGGQPKAGADLVKPTPFTLTPVEINEWNFAFYVKQYEVIGITPPPAPYVTVSKAIEGKGKEDDGATKAIEIPLPDGYQAISGSVSISFNRWDDGRVDVMVDRLWSRRDNGVWFFSLNNQVGSLALSMKSHKVEAFAASAAINCQRTQRALDDWKLKTHSAILQGYQKLLRDYEEKLAALEVQAAQQIQGRNPLENERLIRSELKKGAISVFTDQHYDLFGAIGISPEGYPQPDLPEAAAEGKYIRFFEQAFEWEQMMFFLYPYFWGRKPNWTKRALLQDVDPIFGEFIKAGSARIVVSVRPGFEHAIDHFLNTGETWDGGDLPPITSPLYVSIIEEIRERDKAPGTEIAQGDPWDVRLPTTLTKLRDQPSLPSWRKNAQGEWVPA